MERIISEESAQDQFQTLLDYYDVNLDELGDIAQRIRSRIVKAISYGKVEICVDESGLKVLQNLSNGKSLTYHEVTGQAKVAMERYNGAHEKLYGLLAALSKKPLTEVQRLAAADLSIAECLAAVFLAG
jgi:hypothetical protein